MNRKPKRQTTGKLKAKAWEIFSRIRRQLYADHRGYVSCVTCGKVDHWKNMHAAHYVEKSKGTAVYFECSNVHPACPICNVWNKEMHKRRYTLWMCDTFGRDEVDRLESLSHTTRKISRAEYEELIAFFRECEKELN